MGRVCCTLRLGVGAALLLASGLQAQQFAWMTRFGTPEMESAWAVAHDGAGGAFIGGTTAGDLAGPNGGPEGWPDSFAGRFDGSGDQQWLQQSGGFMFESCYALVPDGAGGAFAATYADLESGELLVSRYAGAGEVGWTTGVPSGPYQEVGFALASDDAGGVFVAGRVQVTPDALDHDILLGRIDGAGEVAWVKTFGTAAKDEAWAAAPDGAGGVFIGGWTVGTLGGPHQGNKDAWLARHDSAGEQRWIVQLGTAGTDEVLALAADGAGGVLAAGYTTGGLGGAKLGGRDAWLARYTADGARSWITQFGSGKDDWVRALAPDGAAGVYAGGVVGGTVFGDHRGGADLFIARFDAQGAVAWGVQDGTSAPEYLDALSSDGAGSLMVAAHAAGSFGGEPFGQDDAIVARFETGDAPGCGGDANGDGVLDFFDFLHFTNLFNGGDPAADCDGDGGFSLFDFLCFVNEFNEGC